ncbi:hypothetical protein BSKO_11137 [Bryopsis sp. KO-2023]|nr:hypothetical protein BSKO_11137 [Bryopsis sp. KO-2023]
MASQTNVFGTVSNETVGGGAAGFQGLSFATAAKRWIQANRTPDVQVPDTLIDLLPFFCVLIIVEMVVSFYNGKKVYYWRQSLSNLAAGALGFAILGIFAKGLLIFPYMAINNKYGLYKGNDLLGNVLCFLGLDLGYWLGHGIAHWTNLGWAGHSIHHSSPDFNLMTNFRQAPHELVIQHLYVSLRASVKARSIKVLFNRDYGEGMVMPNKIAAKDDNPDMPADGIPCDTAFTLMDVYVISQAILCAIPTILIAMVASDRLPLWQTLFLAFQGSVSTIVLPTSFHIHPTGLRNEFLRLAFVAASFLWFFGVPYGYIPVAICAISGLVASSVYPKALQNAKKTAKEHAQ